ncbi:MAG: AraC family transcriptional regulator [Chloroflexota bacterium]|nr:AraC family transcriptional regulator [Chloroflexota bacterium]
MRRSPTGAIAVPAAPPPAVHYATIERVVTALREPAEHALSLHDMADLAGLSPFHFSRVFRGTTGIPPGEFNAALRLDQAKRLLLETELSVTEICFEVGYESLGAFTTRFTRLVGVSPGQFRRLPELTAPFFERVVHDGFTGPCTRSGHPSVTGRLTSPNGTAALTFIGLFPTGIASGRPVTGTILTGDGDFQINGAPDGAYHLLAASLTNADPRAACLIPPEGVFVGSAGPLTVRQGRCPTPIDLRPRRLRPLDPPIIIALPVILRERFPRG